MNRILLVTGSRLFAHHEAPLRASVWAKCRIEDALDALSNKNAAKRTVVAGDARGPDAWSLEGAASRGLRWIRFKIDGSWESTEASGRWEKYLTTHERTQLADPARRPLMRNLGMVRAIANARELGHHATGIALVHPASKTSGTLHTARHATESGIETKVLTYDQGTT